VRFVTFSEYLFPNALGTEHSKGNKTIPEKVATACTKNGRKKNTKTSTAI
jgi:hypothetical protein